MENNIVTIKPLELDKWHGKKGREQFNQPHVIRVLVDKFGKYATGLDEKTRTELEDKLGYNLSDVYIANVAHEFWDSAAGKISLPAVNDLKLDLSNPLQKLKYYNIKASKYVANSIQEYNLGEYPEATHYIFSDENEIENKVTGAKSRQLGYKLLAEMPDGKKNALGWILLGQDLSKQSTDYKDVKLEEFLLSSPKQFVEASQMNKEELQGRKLILEGVSKGVLTKDSAGAFFYLGNKIGFDLPTAVHYITDPNNSDFRVRVMQVIQGE